MYSIKSTSPKTYQVKQSTDPLMPTDTSSYYDYDVISTQNCDGSLPQNSTNPQNHLVMNKDKPDYYYEQQACRERTQQSYFQTSYYSTNDHFTGHYSTNDQFTGHYSNNAQFTDHNSTDAKFAGQILNNTRRVDGHSSYQQPSYSRQDYHFQNDDHYSRKDKSFRNNVQSIKQDVYPQDTNKIHGDQQQFQNLQQLGSSKLLRQQKLSTNNYENPQQLDSSILMRQLINSTNSYENPQQLDSSKVIRQQNISTNNYENTQQLDSSKLLRQRIPSLSQYNHNYDQEKYMPAGKH